MAYNYDRRPRRQGKWADLKIILPMLIIGGGIVCVLLYLSLHK